MATPRVTRLEAKLAWHREVWSNWNPALRPADAVADMVAAGYAEIDRLFHEEELNLKCNCGAPPTPHAIHPMPPELREGEDEGGDGGEHTAGGTVVSIRPQRGKGKDGGE